MAAVRVYRIIFRCKLNFNAYLNKLLFKICLIYNNSR